MQAPNTSQQCSICLDDLSPESGINLACGHSDFCRECLAVYLEKNIATHTYPIKCPHRQCTAYLTTEEIKPLLDFNTFCKFTYVQQKSTDTGSHCPGCSTWNPAARNDDGSNILECVSCALVYCEKHTLAHPSHVSCEQYEKESTIEIPDTKRCPVCSAITHRDQGCFIIDCANCRSFWCYKCTTNLSGSQYIHRCPNCGLGYRKENAAKPSICLTLFCILMSPFWGLLELAWGIFCIPCVLCMMCCDPVGAIGYWCCVCEVAKDFYCCFFDEDEASIEESTREEHQQLEAIVVGPDSGDEEDSFIRVEPLQ